MNVRNEVLRTDQVMQAALLDQELEGPVVMLHLLKFKPGAEYADGRETDLQADVSGDGRIGRAPQGRPGGSTVDRDYPAGIALCWRDRCRGQIIP